MHMCACGKRMAWPAEQQRMSGVRAICCCGKPEHSNLGHLPLLQRHHVWGRRELLQRCLQGEAPVS